MVAAGGYANSCRYGSNVPDSASEPSPLSAENVLAALTADGVGVHSITVKGVTESTNDDVAAVADQGAPEWTVVAADYQTHGRGRLGRSWSAEPGQALMFSVLLRPPADWTSQLGWLPLLAGLAISDALRTLGVVAKVKWPNDVVVPQVDGGFRKISGVLAERHGVAVVVGVGVNVSTGRSSLPIPSATSVRLEGSPANRDQVLTAILGRWVPLYDAFVAANGDARRSGLADFYRQTSLTLGRRVAVQSASGAGLAFSGCAVDIDPDGHLVVDVDGSFRLVTAGDVHVLGPDPS